MIFLISSLDRTIGSFSLHLANFKLIFSCLFQIFLLHNFIKIDKKKQEIIIGNFADNYTSSSYNIQKKGQYYTFNSCRNELSEIAMKHKKR